MKRFSTIAIVALVGLAASCQRPQAGPPVETASAVADAPALTQVGGPVTVSVTCPANDADKGSVSVEPWTVHLKRPDTTPTPSDTTVTWNVEPDTLTVSIGSVDPGRWPFLPIQAHMGSLKAHLNDAARMQKGKKEYRYRLTITCPKQVIEIDPIVIVDK